VFDGAPGSVAPRERQFVSMATALSWAVSDADGGVSRATSELVVLTT